MRIISRVGLMIGAFTLFAASSMAAFGAQDEHDAIVITFKDGHHQSFSLSDVARIQFKTANKTTAVQLPIPSAGNVGHFLGKWKVGDGTGNSFTITLDRNGYATKSIGAGHGTWKVENGEAHISWDDGWHDAIRKVGSTYEKVAHEPGKTFSDPPNNVTDAKSLEPI